MLTAFDTIEYLREQIANNFPSLGPEKHKWETKLEKIKKCFSNHRQIELDEKSGKYLLSHKFYDGYVNPKDAIDVRNVTKGLAVNSFSYERMRLLHTAAEYGDLDCTKWLVEDQGAELDCLTEYRVTPLFLAAANNKVEVMKYLISKGANINCKSGIKVDHEKGNIFERTTPLHIACRFSHVEAVSVLIKNGAALSLDYHNETPLEKTYTLLSVLQNIKNGFDHFAAAIQLGTRDQRDPSAFPIEANLKKILKMLETYYRYQSYIETTLSSITKASEKTDSLVPLLNDSIEEEKAAHEFTVLISACHRVIRQSRKDKIKIPYPIEVKILSFLYGDLEQDYSALRLGKVVAKRTREILIELDQTKAEQQKQEKATLKPLKS